MYLENIVKKTIVNYHNYLSPLMLSKCRYYPSCSQYTLEAIEDKGVIEGIFKGLLRILTCNQFFAGGYDPYKRESVVEVAKANFSTQPKYSSSPSTSLGAGLSRRIFWPRSKNIGTRQHIQR